MSFLETPGSLRILGRLCVKKNTATFVLDSDKPFTFILGCVDFLN